MKRREREVQTKKFALSIIAKLEVIRSDPNALPTTYACVLAEVEKEENPKDGRKAEPTNSTVPEEEERRRRKRKLRESNET